MQKLKKYRWPIVGACFFVIAIVLYFSSQQSDLTVLMYHNFTDNEAYCTTDWTMEADKFREDLQWLKDHGYTTVLPSELVAGQLSSGAPLPKKMVLLTFDDGYESNYTFAYPLLQEFEAKASIALIVSRIGKGDGFLSWEQCREMQASGLVEFGSHTYDHHIRDEVLGITPLNGETKEDYLSRIGDDIAQSAAMIWQELGTEAAYFAYPLGKVEPWADDLLKDCFPLTVTSERGHARLSRGLYKLPRYNVTQWKRAKDFIR